MLPRDATSHQLIFRLFKTTQPNCPGYAIFYHVTPIESLGRYRNNRLPDWGYRSQIGHNSSTILCPRYGSDVNCEGLPITKSLSTK